MLKGYGAVILDGAWLTLQLALSSMALAIVLGLIGVALRLSPVRWLAWDFSRSSLRALNPICPVPTGTALAVSGAWMCSGTPTAQTRLSTRRANVASRAADQQSHRHQGAGAAEIRADERDPTAGHLHAEEQPPQQQPTSVPA